MPLRFTKMHGAGNDFVVLDCREGKTLPEAAVISRMACRHTGVGFDQLLIIEAAHSADAVAAYRILNQDGSSARQCGNGARCVAHWLVLQGATSANEFVLDSPAGRMNVQHTDAGYCVDMGPPAFNPADIPLQAEREALFYPFEYQGDVLQFSAASMGNPHALFVVESVDAAPVPALGFALQASGRFAEGVNVGFAEVLDRRRIRLRVFERGVGETLACGSGACAAAACLIRSGHVDRSLTVQLPGGTLSIEWPEDSAGIRMTGPAVRVFEGEWTHD